MLSVPSPVPLSRELESSFRALIDAKAKPLGSLGQIETLALQLALIAGSATPRADRALLLVFAGDHGLAESGVSAYPADVTRAMVATLLAGKASANAFARAVGATVKVVDAGVLGELPAHPDLIHAKVREGSRNAALEPALTAREVNDALRRGAQIAQNALRQGYNVLALGEMGIGNSASAALLLHRLGPAPLTECVGLGAGHDAVGLERKRAVLAQAAGRSQPNAPLDVLSEFGGLEIAMICGAVIGAASVRLPVVIDGFIASAGALAAIRLAPASQQYCIFSHRSSERGHGLMLDAIQARPLLSLDLRLGEGTGALLALPLLRAACGLMSEVASLDDVLAGRV